MVILTCIFSASTSECLSSASQRPLEQAGLAQAAPPARIGHAVARIALSDLAIGELADRPASPRGERVKMNPDQSVIW